MDVTVGEEDTLTAVLTAVNAPWPAGWSLRFGTGWGDAVRVLQPTGDGAGWSWVVDLSHYRQRDPLAMAQVPRRLSDGGWALPGGAFLPMLYDLNGRPIDPPLRLRFALPEGWRRFVSTAYIVGDADVSLRTSMHQARSSQWWVGPLTSTTLVWDARNVEWVTAGAPPGGLDLKPALALTERALGWLESWDPSGGGRWAVFYQAWPHGFVVLREGPTMRLLSRTSPSGDPTAADGAALLRTLVTDPRDDATLAESLGDYLALLAQLSLGDLSVEDATHWSLHQLQESGVEVQRWFCWDAQLRAKDHTLPQTVGRARGRLGRDEQLTLERLQKEWVDVGVNATPAPFAECWRRLGITVVRRERPHPGQDLWRRALGVERLSPHRLEVLEVSGTSPLQVGDQVRRLWGEPLVHPEDLAWVLAAHPAETPLEVEVIRNGEWLRWQSGGVAWTSTGEQERWMLEAPLPPGGWWEP